MAASGVGKPQLFNIALAGVDASQNSVYPLKVSANGRYLVYQNDRPFLMVGDSPQSLIAALTPAQAETYFANRETNGFNSAWVSILCNSTLTNNCRSNGSTVDGIIPFSTPGDLATPSEAYFERVDEMIDLAANHGIVVFLTPIELIGWLGTLRDTDLTTAFNYGVYLGDRYKDYKNIVWFHGNDFQTWRYTPSDVALVRQIMAGIASRSSQLQTILLDFPVSWSSEASALSAYLDINTAYSYYDPYDAVLSAYNVPSVLPVILGEANYEFEHNFDSEGGSLRNLRKQVYWAFLSGASGYLYGNYYTWQSYWPGQGNLNTQGVIELGYFRSLMESIPWWNLIPDQDHSVVTAGYGIYRTTGTDLQNSTYVTAARVEDGSAVLAYCPRSTTLTVDMTNLSGLSIGRWYDPTNGTVTEISGSPFANTGSRQFPTPGQNSAGEVDWVLVLQTVSP